MSELYLMHHGVKNQRWGVRLYQYKDGSLTPLGRRRAASLKKKYTKLTGKQMRRYPTKKAEVAEKKAKEAAKKSISEMTNEEIQARIDRLRLEATLKSLQPEKKSLGKKLANALMDSVENAIKSKGSALMGDYLDTQLRAKLGMSKKQVKSAADLMAEKAKYYQNRKTVDQIQKYFKEGPYEEKPTSKQGFESKPEKKPETSNTSKPDRGPDPDKTKGVTKNDSESDDIFDIYDFDNDRRRRKQ